MVFDHNQPIYLQIISDLKKKLANGELAPGERVASVRELAVVYGVNPNTMQKALAEMERAGYLYSERTAGRLVTQDEKVIAALKTEERHRAIQHFVDEMTALGVSAEQLTSILADYLANYLQLPTRGR